VKHPLHPALVHFPIASWTLAVLADIGGWIRPLDWLTPATIALLAAGCISGLLAAAAGFVELLRLPAGHPAMKIVNRHMGLALASWILFAINLFLRIDDDVSWPAGAAILLLDAAGMACLLGAGFLGGTLVYRHGLGKC